MSVDASCGTHRNSIKTAGTSETCLRQARGQTGVEDRLSYNPALLVTRNLVGLLAGGDRRRFQLMVP